MITLSPNNPKKFIIAYMIAIALFFLICILSSCKSRKLQKTSENNLDKTEQASVVSKKEVAQDSIKNTNQKDIKESTQSNQTFDSEQTTTINYDTSGKAKTVVIVLKNKTQNLQNTDKLDKSKIEVYKNQVVAKNVDSTGTQKKDILNQKRSKNLESKPNTIKMWVGFAIFLIIVAGAVIAYLRFKKKIIK